MASPFSGKAGRNAAIWTANTAGDWFGELQTLYGGTQARAMDYLTDAYGAGSKTLQSGYTGAKSQLQNYLGAANRTIGTGMDASIGALNQQYGQGRTDIGTALNQQMGAYDTARGDISSGYGSALQQLRDLYGQGAGVMQGAADEYNPLIQRGMQGYDMYMNSLGLNGPGGNAAATGAFQAGPGYQWATQQAQAGAQRAGNAVGASSSGGNVMDAVTRLSHNLANQEYGGWQDRLQGFQGAAERGVAGRTGILQNLGQLYANQGGAEAGLLSEQGRNLAGIEGQRAGAYQHAGDAYSSLQQNLGNAQAGIYQTGYGQQAANDMSTGKALADTRSQYALNQTNLRTQYGGAMANLDTSITDAIAGAMNNKWSTITQAGQQGMMAGQQAAANKWGAIMGGLQMGAGLLGKFFG